jgi:hypothetical protein
LRIQIYRENAKTSQLHVQRNLNSCGGLPSATLNDVHSDEVRALLGSLDEALGSTVLSELKKGVWIEEPHCDGFGVSLVCSANMDA